MNTHLHAQKRSLKRCGNLGSTGGLGPVTHHAADRRYRVGNRTA